MQLATVGGRPSVRCPDRAYLLLDARDPYSVQDGGGGGGDNVQPGGDATKWICRGTAGTDFTTGDDGTPNLASANASQVLQFTGSSTEYLVNDSFIDLSAQTAFTAAWVGFSASSAGAFFSQGNDGTFVTEGMLVFERPSSNTWRFTHADSLGNLNTLSRSAADNNWHYAIATRNGTAHSFAVDGGTAATGTFSITSPGRDYTTVGGYRQDDPATAGSALTGKMAFFAIWLEVLAGDEMTLLENYLASIRDEVNLDVSLSGSTFLDESVEYWDAHDTATLLDSGGAEADDEEGVQDWVGQLGNYNMSADPGTRPQRRDYGSSFGLYFDGSNSDYLRNDSVPQLATDFGTDDFTILAIANVDYTASFFRTIFCQGSNTGQYNHIVLSRTSNTDEWRLYVEDDDDAGAGGDTAAAATTAADESWHYTIAEYDSSTGTVSIQVDGGTAATGTNATLDDIATDRTLIGISRWNGANTTPMEGPIHFVAIFQRLLTASEKTTFNELGAARVGLLETS